VSLWAKLHLDLLDHPALMRAARSESDPQVLQLLPWLIAFGKRANDGGLLTVGDQPADYEDIARSIPGATPATVERALQALQRAGFVTAVTPDVTPPCNGDVTAVTWSLARYSDRQGKPSDSKEAIRERVQRHRDRRRVAPSIKEGNAHVTPPSSNGVTRSEKDEEGDEDEEKRNPSPPSPSPVRAGLRSLLDQAVPGTGGRVLDQFLDELPSDQNETTWVALIAAGWIEGLNLPRAQKAEPADVVAALLEFNAKTHTERQYSPPFLAGIVMAQIRRGAGTNGQGPRAIHPDRARDFWELCLEAGLCSPGLTQATIDEKVRELFTLAKIPDTVEFKTLLAHVQPWTLAHMKLRGAAIAEVAQRLASFKRASDRASERSAATTAVA
jgi:hypothetical protein